MMGSFITRGIIMILGYAYPAYECYKTVEKNKPEIEQLRFWCQYWIIVAILTILERVGDTFVSWLPMYNEAKLAFFIYLWYPQTKGTTYVYQTFLRPYVAKHETDIDRNLLEIRTRAGDMVVLYWKNVSIYAQARFFELLQYVASQSSRPQVAQNAQQPHQAAPAAGAGQNLPTSSSCQLQVAPAAGSHQDLPNSSSSLVQTAPTMGSHQDMPISINCQPPASSLPIQTIVPKQSAKPRQPASSSAPAPATLVQSTDGNEEMEVDAFDVQSKQSVHPQEPSIEQAIRMTRSRLRHTRGQL